MNPTTDIPEAVSTDEPIEDFEKDAQTDTLTVNDRCDSCGAQAYVRVELAAGDLIFCSHHYNELKSKIEPVAAAVTDETWKLYKNTKLDVSA